MTRNKFSAVHLHTKYSENTWKDARTGILLAPGGVRNWPTKTESDMIEKEHAQIRAAEAAERDRKAKMVMKANDFQP